MWLDHPETILAAAPPDAVAYLAELPLEQVRRVLEGREWPAPAVVRKLALGMGMTPEEFLVGLWRIQERRRD